MKIAGSRTGKALMVAFAGESQARNRYTYFASQAKKEGFEQISAIFLETADHEKEHAKRFFNLMEGGVTEITASFPAGVIGKTLDNLKAAAAGEKHESEELYPSFARIARDEGFESAAKLFDGIVAAEKQHERRFRALAENVASGTVFKKAQPVVWRCRNCGYIVRGAEAPAVCVACAHPQAYFEILGENW